MNDFGFSKSESRYKQFQIPASAYVSGYRTLSLDDLVPGNIVGVKMETYRISQRVVAMNKFYRSNIPLLDSLRIEESVEGDEDIREGMMDIHLI